LARRNPAISAGPITINPTTVVGLMVMGPALMAGLRRAKLGR